MRPQSKLISIQDNNSEKSMLNYNNISTAKYTTNNNNNNLNVMNSPYSMNAYTNNTNNMNNMVTLMNTTKHIQACSGALFTKSLKHLNGLKRNPTPSKTEESMEKPNKNIEIISTEELRNFYEEQRRNIHKNNINSFMKNLPKDINQNLTKQEKHLEVYNEEENIKNKIASRISQKINKDKKYLLLNRIENYRAKKDLEEVQKTERVSQTNFEISQLSKNCSEKTMSTLNKNYSERDQW